LKNQNNNLLPTLALNEFSAREIQAFAEDLEKTKKMIRKKTLFSLIETDHKKSWKN